MVKIERSNLTNLSMTAGNEKRYSVIVDGNLVKQWIGFGWIKLREATPDDYKNLPTVAE